MKEVRTRAVELRAEDDEKMVIEGYPVVFNSVATHWGESEVIDPHALDECDMADVPLKYNHEDSFLIMARTRNGSLKLDVDEKGLHMTAELLDTQSNKDLYKCIQAGLLDKMSFAFVVDEDEYDSTTSTRTIKKIGRLFDVSVVDLPFYDDTSVFARGLDNFRIYADLKKQEKREQLKKRLEREQLINRIKR